ncbi:hypothetical protein EUTSA_v10015989mg [Eutrema salsugineum]|uniref:TIR domain-containing protein n=1 Tax=Eutrema salsugineum TaxID=72664 RepID=V4LI13_EUTSA|nr:hypothetical protein EUTSA_v10015989mg [Eutrema salsugineum]
MGQIVMTFFYGVEPYDVLKQTGKFGITFKKTCSGKTEEEDDEANMIVKIAKDVSNKLNTSQYKDFDEMVGLDAHLTELDNKSSTVMAFLVIINLSPEIVSVVADQLSSIGKLYVRISLVMSIISVFLSFVDLEYKIQAHKARFRYMWRPIPWFYYPSSHGYDRIFGSFVDTVLLFCVVGQFYVSAINNWFIFERGSKDGPIKGSVWPLIFAYAMVVSNFMEKHAMVVSKFLEKHAMVVSKFMEKPAMVFIMEKHDMVVSSFMEKQYMVVSMFMEKLSMVVSKFIKKPEI